MNTTRSLATQLRGGLGVVARTLSDDPWLRWSTLGPALLFFLVLGMAVGL